MLDGYSKLYEKKLFGSMKLKLLSWIKYETRSVHLNETAKLMNVFNLSS